MGRYQKWPLRMYSLGLKWDTSDIRYIAMNIKFTIIYIYIYIYLAVVFFICAQLCEASTKYLVSNVILLLILPLFYNSWVYITISFLLSFYDSLNYNHGYVDLFCWINQWSEVKYRPVIICSSLRAPQKDTLPIGTSALVVGIQSWLSS
jgi:hypothetical protein